MKPFKLDKEIYNWMLEKVENFEDQTSKIYGMEVGDILFSYFMSTEDEFYMLNDWDEGEENDPFWNKEQNEHCTSTFLKNTIKELKEKIK